MYPGFNIELEMSEFIKKYKVNVWIYVSTDDKFTEFKRTDTYIYNEDTKIMKLLLLNEAFQNQPDLLSCLDNKHLDLCDMEVYH